MPVPYARTADGLRLDVRLTPRGGRDAVDGIVALSDGRAVLGVRVRAVPEDGKANAALARLLAKEFGVPASAIRVVSGATSRVKTLAIDGDAAALAARLDPWCGPPVG